MPAKIVRRPDGELVAVTGCSGSGKSLHTMRRAAGASRLLVWDAHLEWSGRGCTPVSKIPDLARLCRSKGPAQLAFIGPMTRENFALFSRIALCWAKLGPCTVVVEELADVTDPGKAPQEWGELIRYARKLGCNLYALTQRPSESDKTIIANAHRIVCHAMGRDDDARYMAKELRVSVEEVNSLQFPRLEYIERLPDRTTRRAFNPLPAGARRKKSRTV